MQPVRQHLTADSPTHDTGDTADPASIPSEVLADLVAQSPDGLAVVDEWGVIRYANAAAEALLSGGRAACVGTKFPGAFAPGQTTEVRVPLRGLGFKIVEVCSAEAVWQHRRASLVTLRDVSERKRAEEAARHAIRRRDEFLATLSHELRNPLSAISNAAIVLRKQGVNPDTLVHAREIIERQCRQMTRLLEDLLDMSRIAQGKMQLQPQCHDLQVLVADAVDAVDALMREHELLLEVKLPSEPTYVDVDAVRIHQVLINLLSNAAKYSDRRRRVALTVGRDAGEAVISVRDEGIGMSDHVMASVFEPFVQAGASLTRSEGGLGIGLSLVKSIVELHRGTVTARSEGPGRGSEFVVRLPLSYSVPEAPKSVSPVRTARGLRVLVIEDNSDVRHMLKTLLELEGHDIEVAVDGLQGLEMIEFYQPDVALVDIGLPELDGYEVARQVRANPENENVYLVALTGYGERKDRRRALQAGFDAHLAKPVDLDSLTRLLSECARNKCGANWDADTWTD